MESTQSGKNEDWCEVGGVLTLGQVVHCCDVRESILPPAPLASWPHMGTMMLAQMEIDKNTTFFLFFDCGSLGAGHWANEVHWH